MSQPISALATLPFELVYDDGVDMESAPEPVAAVAESDGP